MAPNYTGLFAGFDLEDVKSCRRLYTTLSYWRSGGRDSAQLRILTKLQRGSIDMISLRMDDSPLVDGIVGRFLSACQSGISASILAAAGDMQAYVVPQAYFPKASGHYAQAFHAWQTSTPIGPTSNVLPDHERRLRCTMASTRDFNTRRAYSQGRGPNAKGGIESDYDTDEEEKKARNRVKKEARALKKAEKARRNATLASCNDYESSTSDALSRRPLRTRLSTRLKNNQMKLDEELARSLFQNDFSVERCASHDGFGDGLQVEQHFGTSDGQSHSNLRHSSLPPSLSNKRLCDSIVKDSDDGTDSGLDSTHKGKPLHRLAHAPKRKPGDRAIDNGTIDRSPAKLHMIEPWKLKFHFETERDDPSTPGEVIPGNPVYFDYLEFHPPIYWANPDHIKRLNQWRSQIFSRSFAPSRKPREMWLVAEKKFLLDQIEELLKKQGFLKWKRLANSYNRHFMDTTQTAGEKVVFHGIKQAPVLIETREAPWRTSKSMISAAGRWTEFDLLLKKYDQVPTINEDQNVLSVEHEGSVGQFDEDGKKRQGKYHSFTNTGELRSRKGVKRKRVRRDDTNGSGDDSEIPDPNPEPPTQPQKRYPKTSIRSSSTASRKRTKLVSSEHVMSIENAETSEDGNDDSEYAWWTKDEHKDKKRNYDDDEYVIPTKNDHKHQEANKYEGGDDDELSEIDYDGEDPEELYGAHSRHRRSGRVKPSSFTRLGGGGNAEPRWVIPYSHLH